jgi:hypothetical protein
LVIRKVTSQLARPGLKPGSGTFIARRLLESTAAASVETFAFFVLAFLEVTQLRDGSSGQGEEVALKGDSSARRARIVAPHRVDWSV